MTNFYIDPAHTSDGDGDGWGDGTGAGDAFNSVPNAVAGGLGAGDIGYIRHFKTDYTADQVWTGSSANAGLPSVLLGVKAATTNTPPVNSDLIDGQWEGSADPAWDTPAEALPGAGSTSTSFDINIEGNWFIYGVSIAPAGSLDCAPTLDGHQIYVECSISAGTAGFNTTIHLGSRATEAAQRLTFCNCEFISTRSSWIMFLSRSGLVEILGGKLTSTIAPTTIFKMDVGDIALHCNGFDMSSVGSGIIVSMTSGMRSAQAKFVNCAKGSGPLVSGTDDPSPWRIEGYNTDANPSSFGSGDAILDLEIQDQAGEIVQSDVTFRKAGADDGASIGGYSLAMTAISANVTQPYVGLEGPWNMLRVGSSLQTTMTVHIANDSGGDLNNDDVRIEVMQPNGSGNLGANEYKMTGMSLLGTPAAMTGGTDGDWTLDTGDANVQTIAVTLDPAYQGMIYWRAITYVADTVYVDPDPVLS